MAERTIEIPEIRLQTMMVGIIGQTPLLTNRFGERARQAIEDKQQKKAKGAKEARRPEEEFQDACHKLTGGGYGFPAVGIKKALVVAGGRFADEKMTHLRGVINIVGDLIEIRSDAPKMRSDTVRLQGGVTSIAYRPMFMPWAMSIPIKFNASIIGEAQILNLFQIAGFSVGLGAWRPECNGTFGTFVLDEAAIHAQAAE
jgi:hypothetical protein